MENSLYYYTGAFGAQTIEAEILEEHFSIIYWCIWCRIVKFEIQDLHLHFSLVHFVHKNKNFEQHTLIIHWYILCTNCEINVERKLFYILLVH